MFNFFKNKPTESAGLFFHTDIHCHIVPGVDDGSPSVERSVELVRSMSGWGITRIIATPHVTQDTFENTPDTIAQPFAELRHALADNDISIELSHSAEYRMDEFFLAQIQAGNLLPMPNGFILVENSYIQEPWNLDKLLFDLNIKGLRPILAHPERYLYYHDKRDRYRQLHDRGTLFQINVLSLSEFYGRAERRVAEWLIEEDMVDFLGTDLHSRQHAASIDSYLNSKDYRRHRKALEGRILNDKAFN